MAATMKDIARRTGLGLATISSYFNGGNVREKNRVKIEEAIEEHEGEPAPGGGTVDSGDHRLWQ